MFLALAACRAPQTSENKNSNAPVAITVSAAASLRDAFREIGAAFEKQTGTKVNFNFASSGALQKQIEQGAPADVFASAGQPQMDALAKQNLIAAETRRDFARNELVLIVPQNFLTKTNSFEQFVNAADMKIAVGNPKTVPVGQYSEQVLRKLGAWERMQNRLIMAEDVRQVLDYVARGETDGGIVYASDLKAATGKVQEHSRPSPDSHDPILYPLAVIRDSKNKEAARKFVEAVLSAEGQRILQKYGFQTAK